MKYRFPFPKNIKINIAYPTGEYAHENFPESKYAVDFLVEIGTKVIAAKMGVVVGIKSDSDEWGLDKNLVDNTNFVVINHKDGTYAEYLHLGKGKVEVQKGDKVETGDLLGYTGYSGVMDLPHLHFNVFKIKDKKGISIPFKFEEI